jgi:hypothetical protein
MVYYTTYMTLGLPLSIFVIVALYLLFTGWYSLGSKFPIFAFELIIRLQPWVIRLPACLIVTAMMLVLCSP